MKNYGLLKYKNTDVNSFTSNNGMLLRKLINPLLRRLLKLAVENEVIIDNYPRLKRKQPYIFVSLHGFVEDTIANLSTIDRNAYLLFGTTNQLEINKEMYFAWLNGFIYVNREDQKSRSDALLKMERVLNNGNSVLIFAEGGFNNTENSLCLRLFASPYYLAKSTKVKVVPIAPFKEYGTKTIYMNIGKPIDLSRFDDKSIALKHLRNRLATLMYQNIERHSSRLQRSKLANDPRMAFMEERKKEYQKTNWTRDVWDEELTRYLDTDDREYNAVQESMDNIVITKDNAKIMAPILIRRAENQKYDFKKYMHENWDK